MDTFIFVIWEAKTTHQDSANAPAILPGPSTRDIEGGKFRRAHISREEGRGLTWLSWQSHGCEHGLKPHKVSLDGSVKEIGDRACQQAASRRKTKCISCCQWGGQ